MKRLTILALLLISFAALKAQTVFSDDFSAGSLGTAWIGNGNYGLSQSGGILTINVNKGTPNQFFTLDWTGNIDISANAVLNLKVKSTRPMILKATLYAGDGTSLSKEIRIGSASTSFTNYCFDYSAFAGKNQANKIEFAVNPPENSFGGIINFDDIVIGTGAVKLANLSPVTDIYVYIGKTGQKILVSDITNASAITIAGAGAVINNITATAIAGGFSTLSFDCLATGTDSATIAATGTGGFSDNSTPVAITVEDDIVPTVTKPANASIPVGKESIILVSGISDGNKSIEQIIKVTAASSNASAIPNPVVVYDTSGSPYAKLKITPTSAGTATITVTVKDNGSSNNTTATTFDVTSYTGFNNAPTINTPVKQTIFNKAPFTLKVLLSGIADGDAGTQTLTITATGKTGKVTPTSPVTLVAGKDTATLTLTATGLGKDTITVTVTDNGDNGSNNGNQTTVITFPVDVLAPAPTGYVIPMVNYSADSLAKLWHVEGQGVTQFARYVDTLGKRCLRINMKQKMDFTGLWFDLFRLPLELDVTNAPYMSYEIMSPNVNPLVTLAYFWDADSVRNLNGGKMVMDTITNTTAFSNVFLDFRLPDYLNGPSGVPINTSRIITVLLNYHLKQLSWPNTFIDGVVYISNIRIGDSCKSIPAITPVCTINPVPTQVVWAGSGQQTVELSGISNGKGNTTGVTMQVLSSKVAFVPAPTLSTLGADGKVTLTYTPGSTIDSSTIVLRVNATGSLQKEIRFQIKSASDLSSSAISINVDATVKGQTITGFGAMDVPDMLLDQYVKDQGCTMMRITYGEGVEIVNDNYSPAILDRSAINKNELNLDYIRSASAAGVTDFFVTLWSPPGWMKQNCSFVGGDYASYDWPNNKNKVDPIYYDEYVEYMVSIIRMVKEETGVEIAGFCPQNEPGFVEPYGSGILDPQHMAQVCGMLGKRLSSEGFNTKVINSEQVFTQGLWPVTQYAAAVKSDTLASKYNKVIAMHYPNDDAAAWAAQWSAVKSANQEFWATECTSEGNNFTNIIFQCKAMIQGFNNGCSAWIIWGYNNGSSGTETDMSKKSGMTFSLGKSIHYHAFKNIAKYVKKGSVQLKSTSGNTSIKVAAFKHDGDSTMTILLLNTDSKMPFSVKLTGSAPANGYEAYRTSFYEHCEKVNPFSGNVIVLPPLSFTTLYIKTNVNHAPSIDQVTDKFMPKNGSSTVNLTGISCGDPSNQSITVTAISSDPSVIPNPVVTYTSPATTGSLAIAPLTDKWGEITITVILKDNGGIAKGGVDTTRMSFKVTIPSSLNDLSDKVSIYPNPVAENLNIAVPSDLASATILITNASGQMVMERKLNHEELIEINVSSLPAGAYMVKIADSKNQARLNFSKK